MTRLFALALCLCAFGAHAAADCASGAVGMWPPIGQPLAPRARLVVDAYGTDRPWVRDIARHSPRLEGAGESVPLRVLEVLEGEFEVTQVVLVAERPLRTGARYRFRMTGRQNPGTFDEEGQRAQLTWTVGPPDDAPPAWVTPPRIDRSSYAPFGCGPAIYAHIPVQVRDASPTLFRVSVQQVIGGTERTYHVPSLDGVLNVGHGMCGGPFVLQAGVRYRVRLSVVDAAGNATPAPGPEMIVEGPAPTGY